MKTTELNVEIPADLKRRIKADAAMANVSLKQYAAAALVHYEASRRMHASSSGIAAALDAALGEACDAATSGESVLPKKQKRGRGGRARAKS